MSILSQMIKNPKIKKTIRKIYFFIFDSKVIDKVNFAFFYHFFKVHYSEIMSSIKCVDRLPGEQVLILAPHCDDEIIGCGGAILSYCQRGKGVYIAYMTDGQKQGSNKDSAAIIAERQNEAYHVAEAIGIPKEHLFFLGGIDGNLLESPVEHKLAQILKEVQPDTIFLPAPLDNHVDHYAVSQKLLSAGNQGELKEVSLYFYESQSPITLVHGNRALRITAHFKKKMDLLTLFKSQPYPFKFAANMNIINGSFWGKDERCEVFLKTDFSHFKRFMATYFQQNQNYFDRKNKLRPNKHSASLIPSYLNSLQEKKILEELKLDQAAEGRDEGQE